jgi:hypothetical protein
MYDPVDPKVNFPEQEEKISSAATKKLPSPTVHWPLLFPNWPSTTSHVPMSMPKASPIRSWWVSTCAVIVVSISLPEAS